MELVPPLAAALVAVALVVIAVVLVTHAERTATRTSVRRAVRDSYRPRTEPTRQDLPAPSGIRTVLDWLGRHLTTAYNREQIRRHLAWAGRASTRDLASTLDSKLAYASVGALLGALLIIMAGAWGWLALVAFVAIGYFLPDLLVYNAGLRRTEEILRTLPDALDLLDLCMESGLSLQASIAQVAENQQGPVAAEFARVLREMQLGKSRSEAFAALGSRTTQTDLVRFVSGLQQAEQLGIPVASVLKEQAASMRHERAREQAQKVPVKILAPLMLCFLPGLFIIILGPAVVNAVNYFSQ